MEGFSWNLIFEFLFEKLTRQLIFYLNLTRMKGTLRENQSLFMTISHSFLLKMRNVSDKSCRKNQNTHFVFSNFFRKLCRLWDNVGNYGRDRQLTDDDIIWRMRISFRIPKVRDTHSEYVIVLGFSIPIKVTRTRLKITSPRTVSYC